MIEAKNVIKSFGNLNALNGVDLNVRKGSIYGLVGPNGAGKTTLMNTLCGIYKANEGEIKIGGSPVYENNDAKKKFVYISDDVFFFHNSSVEDLKNYYRGIYPGFDENMFNSLANSFPDINLKASVRRLSKGMKKQVAFWIALCCKSEILILDEPVDGLDPMMRRRVWSLIMDEVASRSFTVLISSHNLRELEDVCDSIGIMNKGKIVTEASLDDLRTRLNKVQVSFAVDPDLDSLGLEILQKKKTGKVYELIITGEKEQIHKTLNAFEPLFIEELPMTLEEIFIFELGEADDEIKKLLV